MPENNLTVSEINANDIVEQPKHSEAIQNVEYQDTIVVPSQEVNDDIITISIRDDEQPDAVLRAVLLGLAEEQSSLGKLRQKKEKEGKDFSHLSIKRGTLLKYLAETNIQRQALSNVSGELDMKSPKFKEVFKMFLEVISNTFDEIKIPLEYKDLFFHSLSKNLDGWETKAQKIIKTVY